MLATLLLLAPIAQEPSGSPPPVIIAAEVPVPNAAPQLIASQREFSFELDLDTPPPLVEFTLTVTDEEGDPLWLRLKNPPPGVMFRPAANEVGPVSRQVRWRPSRNEGRVHYLVFEAFDARHQERPTRASVRVELWGSVSGGQLQTADVTGDGLFDRIGVARQADVGGTIDAGAVYVWSATAAGSGAPTATLVRANPTAGDLLGIVHIEEVTGDGILDLVVAVPFGSVAGVVGSGLILVFEGGSALVGQPPPVATLMLPQPKAFARFGWDVRMVDLDGDGIRDIVAPSPATDRGGMTSAGAIYVWRGGAQLTGTPAPDAELVREVPQTFDGLGQPRFADVTGDGRVDVLGRVNNRSMLVWSSVNWAGTLTESAELPGYAETLSIGDVTADGILDVVFGDAGAGLGGTVYVYQGGPGLNGVQDTRAALTRPSPSAGDALGIYLDLADVTGDGTLDVLAGGYLLDVNGLPRSGGILVWTGGEVLANNPPPRATLDSNPTVSDDNFSRQGVFLSDVTGDEMLDILVPDPDAERGGKLALGVVYVFGGGAALTGNPDATELLRTRGNNGERLTQEGFELVDVTGDGITDVLTGTPRADVPVADAGVLCLWEGGGGMLTKSDPDAELFVSTAVPGDWLAESTNTFNRIRTFGVADVTGDGRLDVVASTHRADVGKVQTGAAYVWSGDSAWSGDRDADARLRLALPSGLDKLGAYNRAHGLQLVDWSGDGVSDVALASQWLETPQGMDIGGVALWRGGASLAGDVTPTILLTPTLGESGDRLGNAAGESMYWADADDDGRLDLAAGSQLADVGGVTDAGQIVHWRSEAADFAPDEQLFVPGATALDKLGY